MYFKNRFNGKNLSSDEFLLHKWTYAIILLIPLIFFFFYYLKNCVCPIISKLHLYEKEQGKLL